MATLLQIENLTKSYGDRMLFADATFGIDEGDKVGIIARNGMGKTTMLRCIAGLEPFDSGSVTPTSALRMAYLEQSPDMPSEMNAIQWCLDIDSPVTNAVREYEAAMASVDHERVAAASEHMDNLAAWDYHDRLRQTLGRLGISEFEKPLGQLSGGQRKRVALARVVMCDPQLLLLDEPTNHLDIESIEWLEQFLQRSKIALLLVTHDREFLDRVCSRIIEIDRSTTYIYEGNYANYERRRAERIDAMTAELAKVRNTLRKEQEWMNRQPQARAGKARFRIDNFYNLKEKAAVDLRQRDVALNVKAGYIGSKIFEATHICKRFGDHTILDDFSYVFSRYEKVGIIGHNGVGKSTFIKMLLGEIESDSGKWDIGTTVRFGYYRQDGISFNEGKRVVDVITEVADDIVLNGGEIRVNPSQFLQYFLFSPADQQKLVGKLSGGERARLYLASVLLSQPNFLVLDEPTNDLDIATLGILEQYLADFGGCLIVVSHDRRFLDNVVDHLFVLPGDGSVKDFPGTYTEFRAWQARQEAERTAAEAVAQERKAACAEAKPRRSSRPERLTFKEKKEFEALEEELKSLNDELSALESLFQSGSPIEDIAEKSARYEELKSIIDEKEMRWLELSEKA
ncbi:MAG: ABC-F family ATP-binding cassette domain-containing protein [bacterium]|nr:ABC-F family ATP-binding cassette domain-containing protein [bacterium]